MAPTAALHKKNPWAKNGAYDRPTQARIIRAKLHHEFFGGRKPKDLSKEILLGNAVCMILEIKSLEIDHLEKNRALPKDYYQKQARLMAVLQRLAPKGSRGRNPKASQQTNGEGLDLHSIVAGGTRG